jgi:hypothetical protein
MGRQPFGLASPAAFLTAAGWDVVCADVAKDKLSDPTIAAADLVGFHLPMHTATRLAAPVVSRVRRTNPSARVCAYGLYAPLNAEWLRSLGVDAIFGGEFEHELRDWAEGAGSDGASAAPAGTGSTRAPAARPLRDASDAGRRTADRCLHRGLTRLQAPVRALSGRAGL